MTKCLTLLTVPIEPLFNLSETLILSTNIIFSPTYNFNYTGRLTVWEGPMLIRYRYKTSRGNSRAKMHLALRCCPPLFIFFETLFYQMQCKYAMNIGVVEIRGGLLQFFIRKMPFCISAPCCLQFLKQVLKCICFCIFATI